MFKLTNNLLSNQVGYCNLDFITKGNLVTVSGGVVNPRNQYTTNRFIPTNLCPKQNISLGLIGVGDGISMNRPYAEINTDGSITFIGGAGETVCIAYTEYSLL